jgi:dTDP-4-amino-4,6-dideoxygalactose transaminase
MDDNGADPGVYCWNGFVGKMIPYGRQVISADDLEAVARVLRSDYLTTGPEIEIFESELTKWTGGTATVAVSSGTAALHAAYYAAGIKPGDEIITPPLTFIATQATAALLGAKVVFADIQKDTGNIDPVEVRKKISPRTKAIVAVDYAGHPADLEELREICDEFGLILIEDAAHSLGSLYKGKHVGSIADVTTFSFFPTKNITTGEGGAVASIHPEMLEKARYFTRQGLVREKDKQKIKNEGPWHQEVHNFGLNYRLPDVLAALGTSQLQRLNSFKTQRKEVFEYYITELGNMDEITLPTSRKYVDPMWHLFPILVDPLKRKVIFEKLRNKGVGVQVNYMPAHWHPVFEGSPAIGSLPVSENFYNSEISLPMSAALNQDELTKIVRFVKESLQEAM